MGAPAAVLGDLMTATCPSHLIPNPAAAGAPQPAPPLPFSGPLTTGLVPSVLIGGKPAAVIGSSGQNASVHVGLHPTDPCFLPAAQTGRVVAGSISVLIGGQPAARSGSQCVVCLSNPGQLTGSAATVLIGG